MNNNQVYTALRGRKFLNIKYFEELYKNKTDANGKVPTLVLRNPIPRLNFGGAFHSINFKVNQNILLEGLVFFGPLDSDKPENYKLRVEIYESKPNEIYAKQNIKNLIMRKTEEIKDVCAGHLFYVPLDDSALLIKNNRWYLIQFMLDGADTLYLETLSQVVSVKANQGGEIATFFFNSNGSKQVPELKFRLA